jgi:hypothetical protein
LAPVAALAKADAFPAVTVARGTAALDSRAKALDEREQMIARRERELAEQRRVLAEEYRLLRGQRPATTPSAPFGARETVRVAAPQPAATVRFETIHQETGWARLKRVLLGRGAAAVEEN